MNNHIQDDNNNKIVISVIVPAYNVQEYIGNMIETILNQSFTDFELIIVDDCSKDNTIKIIEMYNDDRINVIRRETNSGGAYIPRAEAAAIAKGEWIVYLDADDYIDSTYLEELYERVTEYNADVCSPQMIRVNYNKEPTGWSMPGDDFDFDKLYSNVEAFNLTIPKWRIGMNGAIVRKTVFIAALNYWDEKKGSVRSDEILSRVILLRANGFVPARTKYYYRYNPTSVTSCFNESQFEWMETNSRFISLVKNEFGEQSKEYRNTLLYDYYAFVYTFAFFAQKINEIDMGKKSLIILREWHDRIIWNTVISEMRGSKEKIKPIICRNYRAATIYNFIKYGRYGYFRKLLKQNK